MAGCNPIVNTARIIAAGLPDPNPDNNTSNVTVTPLCADLELTKVVSDLTPIVGTPFSFTETLHNFGPDPAVGVVVSDPLPQGLDFVSTTPAAGPTTRRPASGPWGLCRPAASPRSS